MSTAALPPAHTPYPKGTGTGTGTNTSARAPRSAWEQTLQRAQAQRQDTDALYEQVTAQMARLRKLNQENNFSRRLAAALR